MASPRKFLILAKKEVTQFTDPVPTAGANAILVKNLRIRPLSVTSEDRALIRPYFGNSEQLPVSEEAAIDFDVEIAGGGASPLGTAPGYGVLLQACGFKQVLNASTSVVYEPISASFDFVTIYAYRDGLLYKMTGCVGTVKLTYGAKKIPHYNFSFIGKYVAVSDAAIPSGAVFSTFHQPVASIPSWTGTVTLGGYAAKIADFMFDIGNDLAHAIWMNNETLAITDRKPRGSMTVEMVTVAVKDYWAQVRNASTAALVLTHGNVSGNIVTVTAPAVQLVDVNEAEYEKTMALSFNLAFMPSTGNDDIMITLT